MLFSIFSYFFLNGFFIGNDFISNLLCYNNCLIVIVLSINGKNVFNFMIFSGSFNFLFSFSDKIFVLDMIVGKGIQVFLLGGWLSINFFLDLLDELAVVIRNKESISGKWFNRTDNGIIKMLIL